MTELAPGASSASSVPSALSERLREFVEFRQNSLEGDEKGEAQVFLDRLFQAFGHGGIHEAGGKLEKRVRKGKSGSVSFADLVWKPRVVIEMKKAGARLSDAYQQAFEYWLHLVPDRPHYVVLCNFDEFWIYDLNLQLDDPVDTVKLSDLPKRWEALAFLLPEPLAPVFQNDRVAVTREAAATVARVVNALIERGIERHDAQVFTMQSVMAMFAEDIGLLPTHLFTRAIVDSIEGGSAYDLIFGLFREMNTPGRTAAGRYKDTPYFNGGLFAATSPFDLTADELDALHEAAAGHDWSDVRPEIFGTLFEQSMGADERHAFGAHFTSGADIQRIVFPTIVRPWRDRIDKASTLKELGRVEQDLLSYRVLDPACGCGNFLYVAFRELKKLEREIHDKRRKLSPRAAREGTAVMSLVTPSQFYGIDVNPFAVEIARLTMMLGKELAVVELGDESDPLPLTDLSSNIVTGDALFMDWPSADAIVGNPPYLGRRRLVEERGAEYTSRLNEVFPDVGGVSDYVSYWFRLAQDRLPEGGRAGLVGTNTIRQSDTRKVSLDYVVDNGGTIVDAWSSLPWSGDAAVHVSIVNWVNGDTDQPRVLWMDRGNLRVEVPEITGSLSPTLDLRAARDLPANKRPKVFFQGQTPGHTLGFVLSVAEANDLRQRDPGSSTVILPYIIGDDLLHTGRPERFVIDFATSDPIEAEASAPLAFDRLRQLVLPDRQAAADKEAAANAVAQAANPNARVNWHHRNFLSRWWMHSYRREELLRSLEGKERFIVVSRVASELRKPVFEFVPTAWRPSDAVQCFAWDDEYHLGVLQSSLHEAWFRERCSTLKSDLRYTSKTVFNSFPWPQNPSGAAVADVEAATTAIVELRTKYSNLGRSLAQQYATLRDPGSNPLRDAHTALDAAVINLYGFDPADDLLSQLLALNLTLGAASTA